MTQARSLVVGQAMLRPADGFGGAARISMSGGRITAVEPVTLDPGDPAAELVALPAPANAHDHGRGLRTLAFGALDDLLEIWIGALGQEPVVDPYLRVAVAFARMAEGGVGAANHCHATQRPDRFLEEAEAVSRAARDVGIRVAFGVPIMNRNAVVYGDIDQLLQRLGPEDRDAVVAARRPFRSLAESLALVEAAARLEHEFFQIQYHPIAPQWVDDETMAALAKGSAETGRRVHFHLFETRYQREWADAAYPGGLIRHMDGLGLLSPRLSVAHGVWLRDDEYALLGERGVVLSVNASSNIRLRSGLAGAAAYRHAGLALGIGMDANSFDDDEDMLREARLFWRLNRGFGGEDGLTGTEAFEALCVDGRRSIVGEDGGGAIVPGAPADILVLDRGAMFPDDVGFPVGAMDILLSRMTKAHIHALIVAGREVSRGGRCLTVDLPNLEAQLHAEARAAIAAAPYDTARVARLQAAIADYYRCGCHAPGRAS